MGTRMDSAWVAGSRPHWLSGRVQHILVSALAILLVGVGSGALVSGHSLTVGMALASAGLLIFTLVWPMGGLWMLVALYFFADRWVELGYLPREMRLLEDVILAGLVLGALLRMQSIETARRSAFSLLVPLPLAVSAVLTALATEASASQWLDILRYYLTFPVLFACVVTIGPRLSSLRKLALGVAAIVVLQLPVSLFQYVTSGIVGDWNSGTVNVQGGQQLLFLCLATSLAFLAYVECCQGRRWMAAAVALLLVPPILAGVRATLILAPAFMLIAAATFAVRAPSRRTILGVGVPVTILLVLTAASMLLTPWRGILAQVDPRGASPSGMIAYEADSRTNYTGRLAAVFKASALIGPDAQRAAFGFGVSPRPGVNGQIAGSDLTYGFNAARSEIANSLVQVGWFGVGAMLLTLFLLLRSCIARPASPDRVLFAISMAFPVIVLLYAAMLPYYGEWSCRVASFPVWVLGAYLTLAIGRYGIASGNQV